MDVNKHSAACSIICIVLVVEAHFSLLSVAVQYEEYSAHLTVA